MKREIIFATKNEGKMKEIREIFEGEDFYVVSMSEKNIDITVVENGNTYAENALIKARAIAKVTDAIVLADDSGLEIDYLNNEPGIYSARYLGEDTSYVVKNNHILKHLEGVPMEKRGAKFICTIVAVLPSKEELATRGVIEGKIAMNMEGEGGFGYDPIFFLPEFKRTAAQLTLEEKNKISHRGIALEQMKLLL